MPDIGNRSISVVQDQQGIVHGRKILARAWTESTPVEWNSKRIIPRRLFIQLAERSKLVNYGYASNAPDLIQDARGDRTFLALPRPCVAVVIRRRSADAQEVLIFESVAMI